MTMGLFQPLASARLLGIAGTAVVAALMTSSGAFAPATQPGCSSTFPNTTVAGGQSQIIGGIVGASNSISSVIGTINTQFLAQGNAFVAGLPNPTPDETSGGIWGRAIGGQVATTATGTFNGNIGASPFL